MSDNFLEQGHWTTSYNQINQNDIRRIQQQGTERAKAVRESVNEVQTALNNQVRVDGELAQARGKVDGWNTGYEQNQRPLLSDTTVDLVSTRYPYFKKSYISIDSRLRDKTQYSRPNQYSIYLNNTFQNVERISLIDFETLAPTPTITAGSRQISWAFVPNYSEVSLNFFIQDANPPVSSNVVFGDYYQVKIPDGFYSVNDLRYTIENVMNTVIRRPSVLSNSQFFNQDFLNFQSQYNLSQPVVWTRDTTNNVEPSTQSYRPVFHVRMTPDQGEVAFTCRSEERIIREIRTQIGKPWIEIHLDTSDGNNTNAGLRVRSLELTEFGSGYAIAPIVEFIGGGDPTTPATAIATRSPGIVYEFLPVNKGSGYTSNPSVTINAGSGGFTSAASATAYVGIIKTATIADGDYGIGYGADPTVTLVTMNNQPADGVGAILTVGRFGTRILTLTITFFGTLYQLGNYQVLFTPSQPSGLDFDGGEDPFHARATATVAAGSVTNITLSWKGMGYNDSVQCIIVGDGLGATAEPVVFNTEIIAVNITNGGTGYTTATVFFVGGSMDAYGTATASAAGEVETIVVTAPGSGYTDTTTCVISPPGAGTQAVYDVLVIEAGQISAITLTNQGSGYSSTPTIRFISSSGSGAEAVATMEYENPGQQEVDILFQEPSTSIQQVVIPPGEEGAGYDPIVPPQVYFLGGGGSGASGVAVVSDDLNDGTYGQLIYIALTSGGSGYATSPRIIIQPPLGPGIEAFAFALLGNQFGPPIILTGWRESGLDIGGFGYEWVEEVEYFPFYVLKGQGEETYQTAPAANNVIVPVFAPVYRIAGTTTSLNERDPFDWDYPNVKYIPNEEFARFQVLTGNWEREPGVYRLHPVRFDNVQNIFTFGVANRSQVVLNETNFELSRIRIGRGMPFKWVISPENLDPTTAGGCGSTGNEVVNTNFNLDGSIASLLPLLGYTLGTGNTNISSTSVLSSWRCVWANYMDYQAPSLQTLIAINRVLVKNPPIDYISGTPFIKIPNIPIAPNRYPLLNWPNFVLGNGGFYLLVGESYFYLRLRIPDQTSAPISQDFYIGSSNRDAGNSATASLYTNPISLNETVLLNQGAPSTKTEAGNPDMKIYPPLTAIQTQKSFDGIFAKIRIPMGRMQGELQVIPFTNIYQEELIRNFDRILIDLVDYEGKVLDVRCDHSFVLEVYERKDTMKESYVSTQIGDVSIAGGATRFLPK